MLLPFFVFIAEIVTAYITFDVKILFAVDTILAVFFHNYPPYFRLKISFHIKIAINVRRINVHSGKLIGCANHSKTVSTM